MIESLLNLRISVADAYDNGLIGIANDHIQVEQKVFKEAIAKFKTPVSCTTNGTWLCLETVIDGCKVIYMF